MKYFFSLFVLLACFSCETSKTAATAEAENTTQNEALMENQLKGKWTLDYMSPIAGKDIHQLFKIQKPYLNFVDETKVAGNNGCNNIAGTYTAKDDEIHFNTESFLATRMFCEGVDETAFTGILKTINRFTVINEGQKLLLLTGDIVSMTLVKTEE